MREVHLILSSFAGMLYVTRRGSTSESIIPMVGTRPLAHSCRRLRFSNGLSTTTRSGTIEFGAELGLLVGVEFLRCFVMRCLTMP